MPSDLHKLDLARTGCLYLDVFFDLPAGHPAIAKIDEHLEDRTAGAAYRRSRTEHFVIFAQRSGVDGTSEYRNSWFVSDGQPPGFEMRGDLSAALELGCSAAEHVHMSSMFSAAEGFEPKMTLPASPFASGALSFNQIQGYRVASVEGDRTIWSAVVDWIGPGQGFTVSIHANESGIALAEGPRNLLNYCASIRDSLFVETSNE